MRLLFSLSLLSTSCCVQLDSDGINVGIAQGVDHWLPSEPQNSLIKSGNGTKEELCFEGLRREGA